MLCDFKWGLIEKVTYGKYLQEVRSESLRDLGDGCSRPRKSGQGSNVEVCLVCSGKTKGQCWWNRKSEGR